MRKITIVKKYLMIAIAMGWNMTGYSQVQTGNANVLANGSFEEPGAHAIAADLRKLGVDTGPVEAPWVTGWAVNPSVCNTGKVRIAAADNAPGGGNRHLDVECKGQIHIYTQGGKGGTTYHWSLWAKGDPLPDAAGTAPSLGVALYEYGVLDELTKARGFIGSWPIISIAPSHEWKKYEGTLKASRENADEFAFVLGFSGGRIAVDNIILTPADASTEKIPLKRIFYLPFDNGLDAAQSTGNGKATLIGKVVGQEGKQGKGALFADNAHLEFDAESNFDQNEGTLSMWVKTRWDGDDGRAHCFFEVPAPPAMLLDSGFFLTKGFTDQAGNNIFYFGSCPPWNAMNPAIPFETDRWVHLAFTWSRQAGLMRVHVNGLLVNESQGTFPKYPDSKGRRLIVGARMGGSYPPAPKSLPPEMGNKRRDLPAGGAYSANAAMDELQIFDRMATAEEVWRLAGGRGALPLAAKPELLSSDYLTTLPHDLITPHVAFAKPLRGGPVKALFMTPGCLARDAVELWQRLELDYRAFLLLGEPYGAAPYEPAGAAYLRGSLGGISQAEIEKDLMAKLGSEADVIVLLDADLGKAPAAAQQKVMERVRNGAGLVMTYRAIPSGQPFFEKEDPEGQALISAGVPWSGLPELFRGENIPPSELPKKAIAAYRCGKGRVVAIRFRSGLVEMPGNIAIEDGLTPCLYGAGYTREWDDRYGRYLSLAAKAVLWASGRAQSWRLIMPEDGSSFAHKDLPRKDGFKFQVTAAGTDAGKLAIEIRDPLGNVEFSNAIPLSAKSAGQAVQLTQEIPRLKAGLHYLDARLLANDQTADWGSSAFRISAPEAIMKIALENDSVERGESLRGAVSFSEVLAEPAQLRMRAIDTNGRIYSETSNAVPAGSTNVPFVLRLDDPSTIGSYIEAEIVRGQEILSRASTMAFVPKRDLGASESDEFAQIFWGGVGVFGTDMLAGRQLRKAGFNIGLYWPKDVVGRNTALADFATVAYVTHLSIEDDGNGMERVPGGWNLPDGSLANPDIKERHWQLVQSNLADSRKYGTFFYSLGDEDVYRGEFGYSPWGLKAYHRHLAERYGSIDQLNREWKANYSDFDQAPRLRPAEARTQRNVPAMIDHRSAQELVWRELMVHLREKIRQYDPRAKVGAEASETHDIEAMVTALDVWSPYSDPRLDVLGRCIGKPDSISGHWYGTYFEQQIPKAAATALWDQLLHGFAKAGYYYNGGYTGDGNLMADLSYTPFFKTQLPDLELINGGLGQLLRTCKVKPSGVAIHWSQASRLGLEAADEFGTPSQTDGILILIMKKLGVVNWDYVTDRQIEKNPELALAQRVIFLPLSECLSAAEAAALKKFVEQGGLLVGIGPVGTRSGFGRELDAGQLDEVFGVRMKAPAQMQEVGGIDTNFTWMGTKKLPLKTQSNRANRSVLRLKGEVLAEADGIPIVVRNSFGRGQALLLNMDIGRCDRQALTESIGGLLEDAGVIPPVRFLPEPGPNYGLLKKGDLILLGVLMDYHADKWNGGKAILPEPVHVYDVKAGKYLGKLREIEVTGQTNVQSAALFALQRERIKDVKLTTPKTAKRDQPLVIACAVTAGGKLSCAGRVVRVELCDPNGEKPTYYRRMIYIGADGRGQTTVEFALNDPIGSWVVTATDVASGVRAKATLKLTGPGM